jgi:DNA-binding CsgD family transcriptional regulator
MKMKSNHKREMKHPGRMTKEPEPQCRSADSPGNLNGAAVESAGLPPVLFTFHRSEPNGASRQVRLTRRQAEVVKLVAQGLADKEVGARLGITEETVGGYLKVIYRSCRVQSRTALAVLWLRCRGQGTSSPPHEDGPTKVG